jgi:flagellar protein FliS
MHSSQRPAGRYREVAIKTANPLQLVVMLYDGAIQSLNEAGEHLNRNDIARRARCTNRAVAIISELQACLNFQDGGDIAGSLDRLYTYMKHQIFKANVEKRPEPLAEVAGLLANLRSAWRELAAAKAPNPDAVLNHQVLKEAATGAAHPGSFNISG